VAVLIALKDLAGCRSYKPARWKGSNCA